MAYYSGNNGNGSDILYGETIVREISLKKGNKPKDKDNPHTTSVSPERNKYPSSPKEFMVRNIDDKIEQRKYNKNLNNLGPDDEVSLGQFFKRMYLIAYACLRYPFSLKDRYIDFNTGKVTLLDE